MESVLEKPTVPIDIFEYKNNWKPGFTVKLHSDWTDKGKTWCRRKLERHEWSMTSWTNAYEHTFHFEKEENAQQFAQAFSDNIS
jgi:hypothetical protein